MSDDIPSLDALIGETINDLCTTPISKESIGEQESKIVGEPCLAESKTVGEPCLAEASDTQVPDAAAKDLSSSINECLKNIDGGEDDWMSNFQNLCGDGDDECLNVIKNIFNCLGDEELLSKIAQEVDNSDLSNDDDRKRIFELTSKLISDVDPSESNEMEGFLSKMFTEMNTSKPLDEDMNQSLSDFINGMSQLNKES
eukprot:GHVL01004568.1.p1 GENE.GHVL01004568.1~~GHVL01004568.1.p1  ORF type:complete len:212 (+),score=50.83 GHVL01004568.1:40-636(+)